MDIQCIVVDGDAFKTPSVMELDYLCEDVDVTNHANRAGEVIEIDYVGCAGGRTEGC